MTTDPYVDMNRALRNAVVERSQSNRFRISPSMARAINERWDPFQGQGAEGQAPGED